MIKKIVKTNQILSGQAASESPGRRQDACSRLPFCEKLARNLALAGMLLLTIVSIRNEQLPSGQTVSAAVRQLIEPEWEERLGKINFVGNFLPESVAVFFDTAPSAALAAPCLGPVTHAWTQEEPYLTFQSADGKVYAAASGEVMSVAHGANDENILRIRHDDGYETLYYGLQETAVREGERVTAATCIGNFDPSAPSAFEVRRFGLPVDPTAMLAERSNPS